MTRINEALDRERDLLEAFRETDLKTWLLYLAAEKRGATEDLLRDIWTLRILTCLHIRKKTARVCDLQKQQHDRQTAISGHTLVYLGRVAEPASPSF